MSLYNRRKKSWPKNLPFFLDKVKQTVYNNLEITVKKYPDRDAIIYYDNKISYYTLFMHVKTIAGYLKSINELSNGDRIAIIMQNCPQFIISYYAILGVNCVVVPINPMLQINEISFIIEDSNVKVVFVANELIENVDLALKKLERNFLPIISISYLDYIKKKVNLRLPEDFFFKPKKINNSYNKKWKEILQTKFTNFSHNNNPDQLCIIPYTSGSTGIPKGCIHTNISVNTVIHSYSKWLPLNSNSKVLTTLPLFHVTGMQNSMNVPIFRAHTIVLMSRWDIETALRLIKKYKVNSWRSITTSIIDLISHFDPNKHDISSLRSIGGGGASMPKNTALKLKKFTSLDYIEAYGLTETMAPTHINPPNKPKLGSIGLPLFNVDARIIDVEKFTELGVEQKGELVLSTPQLFLGYLNQSTNHNDYIELDKKCFFRTGDLAYFDNDGYFFVFDRLKRMINSSGFKIWPAEIEKIILNYEGIKEICVIGIPDNRTGQKVKAIIVPEKSYKSDHFLGLKNWCKMNMAKYKIPKIFELRDKLPKNKMGKIMWRDLT